ncbi:MAG: hypothetical protein WC169_04780 [Dehalococcoidia bacterium]|jgi:hypothetical protein
MRIKEQLSRREWVLLAMSHRTTDGMIDLVYTSDDIGGQTGLLVSLPM